MTDFRKGLELLWNGKYTEAICHFNQVSEEEEDPDLFFNRGLCYWKIYLESGEVVHVEQAKKNLEKAIVLNGSDPDAEKILKKITTILQPTPIPQPPIVDVPVSIDVNDQGVIDVKKDGVIMDANFMIAFYENDVQHFPRFLKKVRKRYNLYTSQSVYKEVQSIGLNTPDYNPIQTLIDESLIRVTVPVDAVQILEQRALAECPRGEWIKFTHANRPYAWLNDLTLICLLNILRNPIRYIVTDDSGIQSIVRSLYPQYDEYYYLRPNALFILSADALCRSGSKALWERQLYEGTLF